MLRALHFSDVHVDVPWSSLPPQDLLNKRALGALNLLLRRAKRFAGARSKLRALGDFARSQAVDLLLCTGDYTVLGTEPEYQAARDALSPLLSLGLPLSTVPGNHDLYMPDTRHHRRFERFFGQHIISESPELSVGDSGWPWVHFFGEHVAVVGVNSARPNPQPWRSSGRIQDAELRALERLLQDERLARRFVFILTHYALRRPDGSFDSWTHGLENAEALLSVCREQLGRGAVLHGHIHHRYALDLQGVRTFGAGSATDLGREGLWLFELDGAQARAIPGCFEHGEYRLLPSEAVVF